MYCFPSKAVLTNEAKLRHKMQYVYVHICIYVSLEEEKNMTNNAQNISPAPGVPYMHLPITSCVCTYI